MSEAQTAAIRPPSPLADKLDRIIRAIAHIMCWANAILIGVIIAQVVMRYGFGQGKVVLEELQWHLYAVGVMFGMSYALVEDAHVRVDLLHSYFPNKLKYFVEVVGILLLLLPFLWVVFDHSLDFVYDSYRIDESSDAPTGLPNRWLIKSVIPITFALLILAAVSRLIRDGSALFRRGA